MATGTTFHIEHVLPKSVGGETTLSNLALSCSGCNLAKGDRLAGPAAVPLFNPRHYDSPLLGWYLHFELIGKLESSPHVHRLVRRPSKL